MQCDGRDTHILEGCLPASFTLPFRTYLSPVVVCVVLQCGLDQNSTASAEAEVWPWVWIFFFFFFC
jgi:hypothetical protein